MDYKPSGVLPVEHRMANFRQWLGAPVKPAAAGSTCAILVRCPRAVLHECRLPDASHSHPTRAVASVPMMPVNMARRPRRGPSWYVRMKAHTAIGSRPLGFQSRSL